MVQILIKIHRNIHHGQHLGNEEKSGSISRRHSHKRSHSSRKVSRDRTYNLDFPSNESFASYSSNMNKRKRSSINDNLDSKFLKAKPPTFDGEVKFGQDVEA